MNVITSHNSSYDIKINNNSNHKIDSSSITRKQIDSTSSISSQFGTCCSTSAAVVGPASLGQSIQTFRCSSWHEDSSHSKDVPPKYPTRRTRGRSNSTTSSNDGSCTRKSYNESTLLYIISDEEEENDDVEERLFIRKSIRSCSTSSLIGKTIVIIVNRDST